MVHKCSYLEVLETFFKEPTSIHFVKEISRRIGLAPTSVRNHLKNMLKDGLIKKKESKPFNGFVADRENGRFLFYKRLYNLYSLKPLADFIVPLYYPKLIVVYGSYSIGEDVESSDIDIVVLTKTKKKPGLGEFEKAMKRRIHLIEVNNLDELDKKLLKKIWNGVTLYGGF